MSRSGIFEIMHFVKSTKVDDHDDHIDGMYRKIFDSVMDSLIVFDSQGNILAANRQAQKMFDYDYDTFTKLSWKDIIHRASFEDFERFKEQISVEGYSQYEVFGRRQKGSVLYAWTQGTSFEYLEQSYVTQQKQTEQLNKYLMMHDRLTGLYNRAYFEEEMQRLERGRVFPVSVIMIDVDGLKAVNDSRGHSAGDELLRETARILTRFFRSGDVTARLGGDEFAVLLPGANGLRAIKVISELESLINARNSDFKEFQIQLSMGTATGYQGCSLAEILKEADKRMYEDKGSKVNRR